MKFEEKTRKQKIKYMEEKIPENLLEDFRYWFSEMEPRSFEQYFLGYDFGDDEEEDSDKVFSEFMKYFSLFLKYPHIKLQNGKYINVNEGEDFIPF